MSQKILMIMVLLYLYLPATLEGAPEQPHQPFVITVNDAQTGKGIPLVELKTVNKVSFLTDQYGRAAIYEPGLAEAGEVYFHVRAPHGYEEMEADGFGYRGRRLQVTAGGTATLSLKRKAQAGERPRPTRRELFRLRHPYEIDTSYQPFMITVKDEATGRGVPLVELWTRDDLCFVTDSAGRIAFYEPALMGQEIAFRVKSYGYAPPAGQAKLTTMPGGQGEIVLRRLNIAERLYRITGEGIYRDSVLLGEKTPLEKPLLCGRVLGQDTVAMTEYQGELFWLWGDTERPEYPLGNFKTSSATSLPPGKGGLEPEVGVNLTYFVGKDGFSKPMFPREDAALVWMSTLVSIDEDGTQRLLASFSAMDSSTKPFEEGMAIFNDSTQTFETLAVYGAGHHVRPLGLAYKRDGYVYVNCPYPTIRIRADLATFRDPNLYEAFTCLAPGTGYRGGDSRVERDGGRLVWGWKRNTAPLEDEQWEGLVKAGLVRPDEVWNGIRDAESGKPVRVHRGSAAYNAYKGCWLMVFNESFGESFLGEIWIAAAPAPEGPWTKARKIVTHHSNEDTYTFYNAAWHPVFDREGGRIIYFEGTYVTTYSGNPDPTPRYDYNQIMYRLDLGDRRLGDIRVTGQN